MSIYTTPDLSGLAQAIGNVGTILGEALQKRGQRQQQQQGLSSFQEAMKKASINPETGQPQEISPQDFISILLGSQQQGLTPEMAKTYGNIYSDLYKTSQTQKGSQYSETERKDIRSLQTGLKLVDQMEDLLNKGNIGFSLFPDVKTGEKAKERGKFQKLGQALIPLASAGITIRNQKEFDEYRKIITNPNAPTSKLKGAIEGLKDIITTRLEGYGSYQPSSSYSKIKEEPSIVPSKSSLPKGRVAVRAPDGKTYHLPESQLKEAEKQGFKKI